jgi:hypothetical protein
MAKYIQGADGKLQGSIGDGKTGAPVAPAAPPSGLVLSTLRRRAVQLEEGGIRVEPHLPWWESEKLGKTARKARKAYWNAKLDAELPRIDAALANRGQPPFSEEERKRVIKIAEALPYRHMSRGRAIDQAFADALLWVTAGPDGRLPRRGLAGQLDRRKNRRTKLHLDGGRRILAPY